MILTFLIKKNYDTFKWILLYQALMNLINWIVYDIITYADQNNILTIIFLHVAPFDAQFGFTSVAIMALNRFCQLYFPEFSEKVFTRLKLFIFLIAYDIMICIYIYIYLYIIPSYLIHMVLIFLSFFCLVPLVLSVFIFIKIQQMKKLAHGMYDEGKSLADIQRAALLCFIEPVVFLIYFVFVFTGYFILLKMTEIGDISQISLLVVNIYLTSRYFQNPLYAIVHIAETCLILSLLKSYRTFFKVAYYKCICKSSEFSSTNGVTIR